MADPAQKREPSTPARDEAGVRACLGSWADALRARDVERVMAHYTPDVRCFDLAPPLRLDSAAVRRGLSEWFPTWDGPIGLAISELTVLVDGSLALTHALHHLTGTRTDGTPTDVWFRATTGLRRSNGQWRIVHEHSSVPFYMDGSFKAAVDLTP